MLVRTIVVRGAGVANRRAGAAGRPLLSRRGHRVARPVAGPRKVLLVLQLQLLVALRAAACRKEVTCCSGLSSRPDYEMRAKLTLQNLSVLVSSVACRLELRRASRQSTTAQQQRPPVVVD